MIRCGLAITTFLTAACAASVPVAEIPPVDGKTGAALWSFETAAPAIRAASCPAQLRAIPMEPIKISAEPIELGGGVDGFVYAGGWHLTSSHVGFGGLSGLEMTDDGGLLAVSDAGAFVSIEMGDAGPMGSGAISYMRGADGAQLSGKTDADAEGLAYRDGVALVSFERNHRIMAFDLDRCQSNALGVEIAQLPRQQAGKWLGENKGPEALSLSDAGGLTFGYESGPGGGMPTGIVYGDGRARFTRDAGAPRGFALVGRDEDGERLAELFRSYDPFRGNRNIIRIGGLEGALVKPMTVDNFEGIALQEMLDGKMRIWIISDDNFSHKQRTLLMAFDVTP